MKFSESTKNIFKALADFKKEFKQPLKDADNPFFKSKYVPLENVVQAIDKVAPSKGLSYIQSTISEDNKAGVVTIIIHESGEYIEFDPLFLKPDKSTAQGMGSAITYARRYSLSSAFGVASDVDDDGNEASGNNNQNKKQEDPQLQNKQNFLNKAAKDFEKFGMSKTAFYAGLGQRLQVKDAITEDLSKIIEVSKSWFEEVKAQNQPKEPEQVGLQW